MSSPVDHRCTLASGPVAHVERCACGTVHLHIGGVTMRLHREAFDSLCDTVVQALVAIKLDGAGAPLRVGSPCASA